MSSDPLNNNPTIKVRKGEELQLDAVDGYLKDHIASLEGVPRLTQFPSGNSNLTYLLRYDNRDLVLRRPPAGTKPKSGHSMFREYRIMSALRPVFPAVPETILYEDDESIIGAEFYLMECVEGDLIHDQIPGKWGFGEEQTRTLCTAFWDKLIELHNVDYKAIGLEDFGKPQGYVARQILGWNDRFARALTDDVEPFDDVRKWLEDNIPAESHGTAILHGDFRLDNLILDKKDHFKVLALLDWEISALGDPLMDLGNALAYWTEASDPPYLVAMARQPSMAPGMMTRDEIFAYYCEKRGLSVSGGYVFYLVYGIFRLAVILQQIYYRYYHGQSTNKMFETFGGYANFLGNHCRHLIDKA
jgi:aminoglycoside phosphotransferase (APT) family kinase protein